VKQDNAANDNMIDRTRQVWQPRLGRDVSREDARQITQNVTGFFGILAEVGFTKGRIIVRGKLVTRGKAKRADYVLHFKPNIPLALIEAKDNTHSVGDGMQQGLEYAATLDIPFVFSSNGDGFVFHDRSGTSAEKEANLALDAFPSPSDLWAKYRAWKGLTPEAEEIVLQDYCDDGSGKAPRYYQVNAVNAAIESIAKGRDRVLLVMATAPAKPTPPFRSSGACGRQAERSASCSWPTATC
jgi:type I restriction enzyme R subunit